MTLRTMLIEIHAAQCALRDIMRDGDEVIRDAIILSDDVLDKELSADQEFKISKIIAKLNAALGKE